MKLLIIEDERDLAITIGNYLKSENYNCEYAESIIQAQEKLSLYSYDCILLDLMLGGGNGLDILKGLKSTNRNEGVIIISAKDALDDKVKGLQLGADDYLAKPFHLAELAARIFSVIRRKQFDSGNIFRINELEIDLHSKELKVNDKTVSLTKKEFDLLLFFLGNKNKVISKNALAEHLSGDLADMFDNYEFVYAHVKNLKRKLALAGSKQYIKTVYGTGYKWQYDQTTT